jgi:lysozyme
MRILLLASLMIASSILFAQPSEFTQKWLDTTAAIILDPYQGNDIDWDQVKNDKRVVAVIHKATQGFKTDKKYLTRREFAKSHGYKWGSYHLGIPGNPIKQADYYLSIAGINSDEVYALDIEDINPTTSMPLDSAVIFINRIYEKTGRYPLVYCNRLVQESISQKVDENSVFAKCPLWYARFRKEIPDFSSKIWKKYTLWQFSSELNCSGRKNCPYWVPGTNGYMDKNVYNGTIQELQNRWPDI